LWLNQFLWLLDALQSFAAIKPHVDNHYNDSNLRIRPPKKSLTLEEKWGVRPKKMTLFFVVFQFCAIFPFATPCQLATSAACNHPEKIIPKSLREVFWFFAVVP
jgi:hypothetical protein